MASRRVLVGADGRRMAVAAVAHAADIVVATVG